MFFSTGMIFFVYYLAVLVAVRKISIGVSPVDTLASLFSRTKTTKGQFLTEIFLGGNFPGEGGEKMIKLKSLKEDALLEP